MKKILVLTPRFPYPVIGGDRLRIHKLCEALSTKYELTLLSLCENHHEMAMPIPDEVFKHVHRIYLPPIVSYVNSFISLPTNTPLQVAYYKSPKFKKKLLELLPNHDATFSHLIRVGDYVKELSSVNILEMTDAISLNYKRAKEIRTFNLKSLIFSFEQKRLENYERKMLNYFDLISFVSEVDKRFLFNENNKAQVYTNGVDTSKLSFLKREIGDKKNIKLIFIGNMYSMQNMDAVTWFSKEILQKINVSGFDFSLKIIGKIRESDRNYLNSLPNVFATGAVADIAEFSSDGDFGICPIRIGAGVQNKVLEYMALGLPCITSSIGYEGIGASKSENIFVADSLEDYNNILGKVCAEPLLYDNVALKAREFVEDNYSWSAKLAPLLNDLDLLIGK